MRICFINAVFHYIPLHSSPGGRKYGRASGDFYHTDHLSECVVRLPLFHEMEEHQVHQVVEVIQGFYDRM
jgi:dTDP-4-amino-4,6-dideoxygalactose transaminase